MLVPLLGRAAAFAALLALSTCLTGSHLCPRSLDCAQKGRHFCQPGTSHCGPCLHPLVEDSHGRCVVRRRHASHSLQFIKAPPSSQDVSKPKSKQVIEPGPSHRAPAMEQPMSQSVLFTSMTPLTPTSHTPTILSDPIILSYRSNDNVFIIMSSVFIVAGLLALMIAGAFWIRLQKGITKKMEYPAYGLIRTQTFENLVSRNPG
uniref:Neural proliferation, differentiation and control, 1b n=1 Tax=Mastacembelus armatus TaxID=205130 RepID=A0A3Q3MPR0_9TELE